MSEISPIETKEGVEIKDTIKEIEKEAIGQVSEKTKRKIIKVVASCLSGTVIAGGVGGFIYAGETGNLPTNLNGWNVQETYNEMAEGFRNFFGIEEANGELAALVEGQATFKTIPKEDQQKEEISTKTEENQTIEDNQLETEERQLEFNQDMIKNRFIFPKNVFSLESWMIEGAPVPLWYVQDWSNERGCEYMASGVVAGPLEKGIGATGKEELLLPVAFKNPQTGEFYVRNISFGTDEYLQAGDELGGFGVVFLDNYSYTLAGGLEGYTATIEPFEKIKENIREGDQIAFTFLNKWRVQDFGDPLELIETDNRIKTIDTFMNSYFQNNRTIYEAMRGNEDLPELVITPNMIIVNKIEKNNK